MPKLKNNNRKNAKQVTDGLLKAGHVRKAGDPHDSVKKATVFEVRDSRNRDKGVYYGK